MANSESKPEFVYRVSDWLSDYPVLGRARVISRGPSRLRLHFENDDCGAVFRYRRQCGPSDYPVTAVDALRVYRANTRATLKRLERQIQEQQLFLAVTPKQAW